MHAITLSLRDQHENATVKNSGYILVSWYMQISCNKVIVGGFLLVNSLLELCIERVSPSRFLPSCQVKSTKSLAHFKRLSKLFMKHELLLLVHVSKTYTERPRDVSQNLQGPSQFARLVACNPWSNYSGIVASWYNPHHTNISYVLYFYFYINI